MEFELIRPMSNRDGRIRKGSWWVTRLLKKWESLIGVERASHICERSKTTVTVSDVNDKESGQEKGQMENKDLTKNSQDYKWLGEGLHKKGKAITGCKQFNVDCNCRT